MSYAIAIALVWIVLFAPVGLVVQRFILAPDSRAHAVALSPLVGLAIATVLFSIIGLLGVSMGSVWLQIAVAVIAAICVGTLVRVKYGLPWRQIIGPAAVLLLLIILLVVPTWGGPSVGPLAYATQHEPVLDTAMVRAAAGGDSSSTLGASAAHALTHGYTGFERLAGFSVGLGGAQAGSWSAFDIYSVLCALCLAFTVLPLVALARDRGVGWFGTLLAAIVGAAAPATALALGFAQGPSTLATAFVALALLAVTRARKDRGWWVIAASAIAALLAVAGPLGLVATVAFVAIVVLVRNAREGRVSSAAACAKWSTITPVSLLVLILGVCSALGGLLATRGITWDRMYHHLGDAEFAWPLSWIGPRLHAYAPATVADLIGWAVGIALIVLAVGFALARRESTEIGLIGAAAVGLAVGTGIAFADWQLGIRMIEYNWAVMSPALAFVCIRAVGLARGSIATTSEDQRTRRARFGPMVLGAVFVVLCISASVTTARRFTQTPPLPNNLDHQDAPTLSLSSDRWLRFAFPNIDYVRDTHNLDGLPANTLPSILRLVVPYDPLASDPPSYFSPSQPAFTSTSLGVVGFSNSSLDAAQAAPVVDGAKPMPAANLTVQPLVHYPAEADPANSLGGLVVPPLAGQSTHGNVVGNCSAPGFEAVDAPPQVPGISAAGTACLTVPVASGATFARVHLRDLGYYLAPNVAAAQAVHKTGSWRMGSFAGAPAWIAAHGNARLTLPFGALPTGCYQVAIEGRPGIGTHLSSSVDVADQDLANACLLQSTGDLTQNASRWSAPVPVYQDGAAPDVATDATTEMSVARVFVRPDDQANDGYCDLAIPLRSGVSRGIADGREVAHLKGAHQPTLFASVLHVQKGPRGKRTAAIAVRMYAGIAGERPSLPASGGKATSALIFSHTLVDYVEEFGHKISSDGCALHGTTTTAKSS